MNNTLKTAALLGLLSGLLLVVGSALGGQQGLVVAFVFAALMNFGTYWYSDKLILRMYRAQPVGPDRESLWPRVGPAEDRRSRGDDRAAGRPRRGRHHRAWRHDARQRAQPGGVASTIDN